MSFCVVGGDLTHAMLRVYGGFCARACMLCSWLLLSVYVSVSCPLLVLCFLAACLSPLAFSSPFFLLTLCFVVSSVLTLSHTLVTYMI